MDSFSPSHLFWVLGLSYVPPRKCLRVNRIVVFAAAAVVFAAAFAFAADSVVVAFESYQWLVQEYFERY